MTPIAYILLYISGGFLGVGTMFFSKTESSNDYKWYEIAFSMSISALSILFWIAVTCYHRNKKKG